MKSRPVISLAFVALLASFAAEASAQQAGPQPLKIAIANTGRIFREMQETKDLGQRMNDQRQKLTQEARQKQEEVRVLQEGRDQLRPESAQYQERNQQWIRAAIEFDTWTKIQQAELQRQEKIQTKALFDKIEQAVAQVAQQRGYELVLADKRNEIQNLDQLNLEQLSALLNQRDVLYAVPQADITAEVIAHLDQQYKSGGGR